MQTFHRGDDINLDTIVYTDKTFATVKTDLTGATLLGRIGDLDNRHTHVEVTGSIVDVALGHIRCTFTDVQTELLAPGEYTFQTEVTDTGGFKAVTTDERIKIIGALKAP